MDLRSVRTIAAQELTVNIRNKWTVIFAVVFGSLVLAISYFGAVTSGTLGFQSFNRTSASLLSLVLYLIPLVALLMGTLSFSGGSAGDGEMLFAQPVTRGDILVGKLLGLLAAMATATFFGFGLGGIVVATQIGTEDILGYPVFVLLSLLLALIFLCIAALVSIASKRGPKAFGIAVLVWFFFVLFYDLLVLGVTLLLKERAANYFIFGSLFGNPVDMIRVAGLVSLNGEEIFGAAGAALMKFMGGELPGLAALLVGIILWIAVPLVVAWRIWLRHDVS